MSWIENVGQIEPTGDGEYSWLLPYNYVTSNLRCVTSPWFSSAGEKFRLVKVPSGYGKDGMRFIREGERDVGLFLWKKLGILNHEYSVTLGILTFNGDKVYTKSGKIESDFGFGTWCLMSVGDFVNRSYRSVCQNGLMKIFCTIERIENQPIEDLLTCAITSQEVESSSESEKEEETKEAEVKGLERLARNLKNLLMDGQNSDVILKAENREFRVHKGILGARSPVFASMFQLDMKEKTSDVVDIPDCTAESFEVFLLYMYTGAAETMSSDNVSNLYYAADKYRVDDLKEECVQFMKDNMSVENVCDVVALSLRHSEKGLLKEATNFFRQHIKEIIKTVKWQTYLQENSTHANELLVKALDA